MRDRKKTQRPSIVVISDWLANCRSGQWTPFEGAKAIKDALAKEGYLVAPACRDALAKQVTIAALAALGKGGDNLAVFEAVRDSLADTKAPA